MHTNFSFPCYMTTVFIDEPFEYVCRLYTVYTFLHFQALSKQQFSSPSLLHLKQYICQQNRFVRCQRPLGTQNW